MKIKSEFKKYIKKYKFNSWFIKNLILLFILIIIPITGMFVLIYYSYDKMQKNEIKSFSESVITDTISDFDRIMKEAKTQLIYIGFNSDVELYMYDTKEIKQLNYKIKNISEFLRFPIISKNYVDSIYILSRKSNKVIALEGISDLEFFEEKECLTTYLEQSPDNLKSILLTSNYRTGFEKKQLSIYHPIKYGTLSNGIVVMNLKLPELLKEMKLKEEVQIYITDGEQILLSNAKDDIGQPITEVGHYKERAVNSTIIKKGYAISSHFSEETRLEVISYFDLKIYQNQLNTIRNFMLVFVFSMIIVTIGLGAFTSIRIFTPIGTIISSFEQYSNVLFGEDAILKEKDELMYILNSIQKTVNTKKGIDEELAERVRLLKKAQSVALQSQINPHFFNNTLDTINWMAIGLLGNKNEISEMTNALSKMLRMSLESTDTIIPLKSEIEHCMTYLEIQKKRYEDKFEVMWQIPSELYECKTIRIILQPIIENAIYHGVKPLSNQGKISVTGQFQEDTVEISIEDNGLGMTEKELMALKVSMENRMVKESKHIGVSNVNQRLKLYFGEEYGIQIDSKEGFGTKVTLRFPHIPSKDELPIKTKDTLI